MKPLVFLFLFISGAVFAEHPNFILILSDDQDWTGTSVQMHPDLPTSRNHYIETLNLEQLAKKGMVFSAAYAPAPVCSPTRISLQTGKSPAALHWTKAGPVMTAADNYPLLPPAIEKNIPTGETTIAEILKTAGYATAHYGKWHLSGGGPEKHGYDVSDGDTDNKDAAPHVAPNSVDIFGITERAGEFMEKNVKAGKPFFMQLSHHALHYPENADKELVRKYAARSGGSIEDKNVQRMALAEQLDQGVGLIMKKVDDLGIADLTYVIYMSDNGGGGGKKGDRPLTAGKGGVWEGGIRVPLIIRGPGMKAGVYCNTPIVGYDLFPTLCALGGITEPLPNGVEGGNIAPLFATGTGVVSRAREELVFHFPHYQGDTPQSAIILGNYKLIKWYEDDHCRLFDLSKDIGEGNDLSQLMPEKTAELKALLEQYLKDIGAQLPMVNPGYDSAATSTSRHTGKERKKGGGRIR